MLQYLYRSARLPIDGQAHGLVCCIASTGCCQEYPFWMGAEEWTDALGNAAFVTTQEFVEGVHLEIVVYLKWHRKKGVHQQRQELFKILASVVKSWILEEK